MTNTILSTSTVIELAHSAASTIGSFYAPSYDNPVKVWAVGSLIWFSVASNYSATPGALPTSCAIGVNYAGKAMTGNKAASHCLDSGFVALCQAKVAAVLK